MAAHRAAYLEFETSKIDEDDPRYDEEMKHLSDADEAAVWNLSHIQPTTHAGAIVLLRYVAEIEGRGEQYDFEDYGRQNEAVVLFCEPECRRCA